MCAENTGPQFEGIWEVGQRGLPLHGFLGGTGTNHSPLSHFNTRSYRSRGALCPSPLEVSRRDDGSQMLSHLIKVWVGTTSQVCLVSTSAHTHSRDASLRQADPDARAADHNLGGHHIIPPSPRAGPPRVLLCSSEGKILPVFSFV